MERERTGHEELTAEVGLQMNRLEEDGLRLREGAPILGAGCTVAAAVLQEWEHIGWWEVPRQEGRCKAMLFVRQRWALVTG